MHNNISSTCVLIGILACGLPAVSQSPRQTPLAASEALGRFELADPSNNIQLLASEPLVVDPVDIAFDEAGRLWVVEMRDYPLLPAGQKPRGRIKVLLDENHDGNFDTSRVFVDDLNMPTGHEAPRQEPSSPWWASPSSQPSIGSGCAWHERQLPILERTQRPGKPATCPKFQS